MNHIRPPDLLLCGALLALAGCAVGPNYHRPVVATPAFKESGDWQPANPADQQARGPWWRDFGDPVLDELEERVDISDNTILLAEATWRQARADATVANAALFPSITAEGSASRTQSPKAETSSASLANTFASSLLATWEFDLWGRVRRSAEAGRATAAASAADLESARLSEHALLAQTYFALRVTETDQTLYAQIVSDYGRFLEITRQRYAQGVDSRADVASAEAQLKSAQAEALDLGLERAQYEHAIAVLLGEPPATFSIAPAPIVTQVPLSPAAVASQLLERRPDIAAAERRLAAANAEIGVATGGFFPVLSLSAAGGYEAARYQNLFSAPNRLWSLGAGATLPLFDAGSTYAEVKGARAAYDAALITYRQTVLAAFQEVEDNLAAVSLLAKESGVRTEALTAARQAATIVMNQYKAGTVSYLNVITAEATRLQAELAANEILGRRLTAVVTLFKAVGGRPEATAPTTGTAAE